MVTYLILTIVVNILIHKSLLKTVDECNSYNELSLPSKIIALIIVMLLWPIMLLKFIYLFIEERM